MTTNDYTRERRHSQHRPKFTRPLLVPTTTPNTSTARRTPAKDVKILYGRSAARCAFADCRKDQILEENPVDGQNQIGKIAHIVGHSDDGPRGDAGYPREKLDTYENWILLCPSHHDTVDALISRFMPDDLRKIKARHEEWVRQRLETEVSNVNFGELEMVAAAIMRSTTAAPGDLSLTPLKEKIEKNDLTASSESLITLGLSQNKEVGRFVEHMAQWDSDFPGRLIKGFVMEYDRLSGEGIFADQLFEQLWDFASGGGQDFRRRAAGLSILTYLFERCAVFKK